jgi:hypothetical protein
LIDGSAIFFAEMKVGDITQRRLDRHSRHSYLICQNFDSQNAAKRTSQRKLVNVVQCRVCIQICNMIRRSITIMEVIR